MNKKVFDLNDVLGAQEILDIQAKIADLKTTMSRVKVSLSNTERQHARSVAHRREAYVRSVARVGQNFERVLPRDIEVNNIAKLIDNYQIHKELKIALDELNEMNNDTIIAIGKSIMAEADSIYGALQQARKRDGSLDTAMDEVEEFYRRSNEDDTISNPPADSAEVD